MDELYALLPEDVEYLNAHHQSRWRKVTEGAGKFGLILCRYALPDGFAESETNLMLLVPSGYPGVPIDMFYLNPPIHRRDGAPINALADELHFDVTWQRWSRHYAWNPGEDNLVAHLEYVRHELESEAAR